MVNNSLDWSEILLIAVVVLATGFFLGGWLMMLLMSVLHTWWHAVPTMGYWTSALVALLLRLILATSSQTKTAK